MINNKKISISENGILIFFYGISGGKMDYKRMIDTAIEKDGTKIEFHHL